MKSNRKNHPVDVRRIDWRFLLPNPKLGNIGFVGSQPSDLLDALRQFSEKVSVLNAKNQHFSDELDVLVVESGTAEQLRKLAMHLKPGGFLYWEIKKARFRNPNYYLTQIFNGQFFDAKVYWHRPGFQSCKEIIPLEDQVALRYVFSRNQAGLKGNVLKLVSPVFCRSSLLGFLAPSISIVARYNSRQNQEC